ESAITFDSKDSAPDSCRFEIHFAWCGHLATVPPKRPFLMQSAARIGEKTRRTGENCCHAGRMRQDLGRFWQEKRAVVKPPPKSVREKTLCRARYFPGWGTIRR